MKQGSSQRRQIESSFEKIQIQREDLKVKNQFWSAYFSGSIVKDFLVYQFVFLLPLFMDCLYIFLLLVLFFLVHFDVPFRLAFFSNTYFSNFISLLPREQQDLSFKFILNFCLSLFHRALLYYCHMNSSTKSGKITRYFAFQFLGWRKTNNYLFTSLTKC